MLSPDDRLRLSRIGSKPWPAAPGRFVALACLNGYGPGTAAAAGCGASDDRPRLRAILAVVGTGQDGAPKLEMAPVAVDPRIDWHGSLLASAPFEIENPGSAPEGLPAPSSFDRIDVAPYRIAPGVPAFGLRASWRHGFSGGFSVHGALLLYSVVDGALRRVLAVPAFSLDDFAGDWNRDGTRRHEVQDGDVVLAVLTHLTAGHFDMIARSRPGRHKQVFCWDAAGGRYRPAR